MVPICALMGACFSYGFSSSRENNGISDGDDDGDGDGSTDDDSSKYELDILVMESEIPLQIFTI